MNFFNPIPITPNGIHALAAVATDTDLNLAVGLGLILLIDPRSATELARTLRLVFQLGRVGAKSIHTRTHAIFAGIFGWITRSARKVQ